SYAPCQVLIQVGTDFHDLETVVIRDINLFYYWQEFFLVSKTSHIEALMLRLVIVSNYYSGIDSRIRQILICGPEDKNSTDVAFENISKLSDLPKNFPNTIR
ncbi:hypothetical protein MXB_3524, partial [Myxobolus squamalis]